MIFLYEGKCCIPLALEKDLKLNTVHRIEFGIDKCDRVRKKFPHTSNPAYNLTS